MERMTHRSEEDKKYIINRLKTIEGQIRGVSNMVSEDRYCNDILIQLLAINKSIKGISQEILKNHLSYCVVEDIKQDKLEVIDEVMDLINKIA